MNIYILYINSYIYKATNQKRDTINKINYVGRLKFRINLHSVASTYITKMGDNTFPEICYFFDMWACGVFTASVFVCYHK